jgi:sigma-B regulation protein RsbU (phosphoserine phosphatase)
MARLVALAGPDAGTIFEVSGTVRIGPGPGCEVRLTDTGAGDEVLCIAHRKGRFFAEPLGRTGFYRNDAEPADDALEHGDVLSFGTTRLVFVDEEKKRRRASDTLVLRKNFGTGLDSIIRSFARARMPEKRLRSLLELSRTLRTPGDLEQTLAGVLDVVLRAFGGDRAAVLFHDGKTQEFHPAAVKFSHDLTPGDDPFWSRGILAEVVRTGESILTRDTQTDRRFGAMDSVVAYNIVSSMCAALPGEGGAAGVLYVDTFMRRSAFSEEDLEMFSAIAQQASAVIENARLYRELERRARMDKELEVASRIQQRVFPVQPPRMEKLDIFGLCRSAREVGGDYYDFLRSDGGALYLAVGDVSGKGITAGLVMMMVRSLFRPLARKDQAPLEVLELMNRDLLADTRVETFVTFGVVRWSPGEDRLHFARAGHESLLVFRPRSGDVEEHLPRGPALGIVEKLREDSEEVELPFGPGDLVFLYSDGATETMSPAGNLFGRERLLECIQKRISMGVRGLVEGVMEEILAFTEGAGQTDDITLLALRRGEPDA